MGKFFKEVGWILSRIVFAVIAVAMLYFGVQAWLNNSTGWAILWFIAAIVFSVMTFVAFRQKPSWIIIRQDGMADEEAGDMTTADLGSWLTGEVIKGRRENMEQSGKRNHLPEEAQIMYQRAVAL